MVINESFSVLNKDKVVGHITIKNSELVEFTVVDGLKRFEHPWPLVNDFNSLMDCLADRVMPPEQFDDAMAAYLGMTEWDMWKLMHISHGQLPDDSWWFRFDNEDLHYADVHKEWR